MTDVSNSPPRAALSRRGFVSLGIGALAVASLPVAMWRRKQVTRRALPAMGTIADFVVVSARPDVANGALDAAFAELRRVETLMTRFSPVSDIGRVNRARVGERVHVSRETALVVAEGLAWAATSSGAFDPAVGSAVELWDVTHRHEPPPEELVAALAGRKFHETIEVDARPSGAGIVRHAPDAHLDLGGIAGGYGVDRASGILREWGITNAVLDLGGDIYAMGDGMDGDGWRIGIRSPFSADDVVRVMRVRDAAVSTSGTYQQYFQYRGRRFHHLMDPATAAPRRTLVQSLTIQADSCMHADVATTACFGMTPAAAAGLLAARAPGSRIVSTI